MFDSALKTFFFCPENILCRPKEAIILEENVFGTKTFDSVSIYLKQKEYLNDYEILYPTYLSDIFAIYLPITSSSIYSNKSAKKDQTFRNKQIAGLK